MIESATQRQNLPAKRTKPGEDRNAFPRNGFAMAIPTALMALMRTQRFTIVQHRSLARTISSLARMAVASTRDGRAIMTTIVGMDLMKESSATLNIRLARRKSLRARTSSVLEINTDAVSQDFHSNLFKLSFNFFRRWRR